MRRWVRYEAPVMVCVETDKDGDEHVRVVAVCDVRERIPLARDHRGHFQVYAEQQAEDGFGPELVPIADDSADRAVAMAENLPWPDPLSWEHGPDALEDPGCYVDEADDSDDDDEDERVLYIG